MTYDQIATNEILVDLHCHSTYSDGEITPEVLAEKLHKSGVRYASLTDHNTIEGLDVFQQALLKYDIGFITGVEITTVHDEEVIHLLGYGFDATYKPLLAKLSDIRMIENPSAVTVAATRISTKEAISLLHQSGGIAIMAHPLKTEGDTDKLQKIIRALLDAGLDGIEAVCAQNMEGETKLLLNWVTAFTLVTSAGSDGHNGNSVFGVSMEYHLWKNFRDALLKAALRYFEVGQKIEPITARKDKKKGLVIFLNMIFPAVLALILFVIALFGVLTPFFEKSLFERKRESVRDITKAALGVLNEAAEEVANNQMSLEKAQELAKRRIESMRFGRDGEDYFWIQDLTPRILMHPYRPDLVNQDVSEFKDARNVKIFVEFAKVALEKEEGFVSYVWQWNDDRSRLEAKESYVRLFEKWNWIIGSGIYDKEVKEDIAKLEGYFLLISIFIDLVIIVIIFILVGNGLKSEKAKRKAERLLNESADRYRALTEAANEGVLILTMSRCSYANAVMYELLGCGEPQLQLLEVDDIFPDISGNEIWRDALHNQSIEKTISRVSGILKRSDGKLIQCEFALKGESAKVDGGMIVLVRRLIDGSENTNRRYKLDRLLQSPNGLVTDIIEAIANAREVNDIVLISHRMQELVHSLLTGAVSATDVSRILSNITDVTTQKLIDIAVKEIGVPPSEFVFLGLGSHGREAQTLYSDQDNAIVYRVSSQINEEETKSYYLALADKVCSGLELAGYRKCAGQKMANNPQWCQPIANWKNYFDKWVQCQNPEDIMEFTVFFDFRAVAGTETIAKELRNHLAFLLVDNPPFLVQMAKSALLFTPPIRLFGNFVIDSNKDHPGQLDVKAPNLAIVSFVRLYALKEGIKETNTVERLDAITRTGVLLESTRRDITTAFEALFRLRLWNQVISLQSNYELSNWINPSHLGHIEEVILTECFKEIEVLRNRIQRDFFGGNQGI